MKIAIESNDGVTIKSPFVRTTGYLVYDVEQSGIKGTEFRKTAPKQRTIGSVTKLPAMVNDCKTVISRGMNRGNLQSLKEKGIDVFITFKLSARDAVKFYLKENFINSKTLY
jgi:predicted Fe-Mo cluster-binding NifX family protein